MKVVREYSDGSSLVEESGLSPEHARRMARHLGKLGEPSGCTWYVESEPVQVPEEVLEGIEDVRSSGRVNMLDRPGVQLVASELGHHGTVLWIEENKESYAAGIFYDGFSPKGR